MSKLLEELAAEFEARRPPPEAITVSQFAERVNVSKGFARAELEKLVKSDKWTSVKYGGSKYYWKP